MFVNARREPLTRSGFAYLLKQHAATAARTQPGLGKKRVSPDPETIINPGQFSMEILGQFSAEIDSGISKCA